MKTASRLPLKRCGEFEGRRMRRRNKASMRPSETGKQKETSERTRRGSLAGAGKVRAA